MNNEVDYKKFQAMMNEGRSVNPVTEDEAAEAYRNLGEFILLLYKINARECVVARHQLTGTYTKPTGSDLSKPNPSPKLD
ncbi:MAG: hypothetical protein WAO98_08860 [Alphaproteobacteria bacterium]